MRALRQVEVSAGIEFAGQSKHAAKQARYGREGDAGLPVLRASLKGKKRRTAVNEYHYTCGSCGNRTLVFLHGEEHDGKSDMVVCDQCGDDVTVKLARDGQLTESN